MNDARTSDSTWAFRAWRASTALALLSIGAVVATGWAYYFVAQPMNDDFTSAASAARGVGAVGFAYRQYFAWSGRWACHSLGQSVFNLVDVTRHYGATLAAFGAIELSAFYVGIRALLGESASRGTSALLALGVSALLWASRPWPGQTVYWLSGVIPYGFSISLAILSYAGLARWGRAGTGRGPRFVQLAGLSALAVFVSGLHELVSLSSCLVLALGAGVAWRVKGSQRVAWLVVFLFALAGLVVMVLAPGNAVRGERMQSGGDVAATLAVLYKHLPILADRWILDPKLLAATAVLILDPRISALRPKWLSLPGIPWRVLIPSLCFALVVGALAITPWATGFRAQGRTLDVAYTVFLLGWLTSWFVLTRGWTIPAKLEPVFELTGAAALVALAAALVTTGNASTAIPDLVGGRASTWSDAMADRFETMRAVGEGRRPGPAARRPRGKDLVLTRLPECPRVLWAYSDRSGHFVEDPAHWSNVGLAELFGLGSVRLAPAEEDQE